MTIDRRREDLAMQNPNPDLEQHRRIEYTAIAAALDWSGWGSPIGLSVLICAVGFFLVCLHWAGILH
jgi:hypothetical protein